MTLDRDVELLIREAMHRSRKSFKETLNAGLRAGLRTGAGGRTSAPFVVKARPLGLRAGFEPAGFNRLADELEAEAYAKSARRARKR
ncbi:MAG: hypothetical protein IT518_09300 [Burkholderiales bacterium]|nr:hypothetical protein [Burkholderiales bacterium]